MLLVSWGGGGGGAGADPGILKGGVRRNFFQKGGVGCPTTYSGAICIANKQNLLKKGGHYGTIEIFSILGAVGLAAKLTSYLECCLLFHWLAMPLSALKFNIQAETACPAGWAIPAVHSIDSSPFHPFQRLYSPSIDYKDVHQY